MPCIYILSIICMDYCSNGSMHSATTGPATGNIFKRQTIFCAIALMSGNNSTRSSSRSKVKVTHMQGRCQLWTSLLFCCWFSNLHYKGDVVCCFCLRSSFQFGVVECWSSVQFGEGTSGDNQLKSATSV